MSIERSPDDIPTLESDSPPESGGGTASPAIDLLPREPAQPSPAPITAAKTTEIVEDDALEHDIFVGRRIGSYLVRSQIGKGGMGAVYLGEHPKIGSKVAIKFLHPKFASDRRVVERFFNEARAVNLIGHPNILRIHDLDSTSDGYHYCVMELLEGQTLQTFLRARGRLSLAEAMPILEGLCNALSAAHARGIVHRDLKPENIFLVANPGEPMVVKVVDFGIAKLTNRPVDSLNTVTGTVIGTPAYMSPEQAEGEGHEVDARSDLYSLGVLTFQLFTGQLPFQGAFGRMLVSHISVAPPPPRRFEPSISPSLERLILSALAKSPAERPQTAAEFLAALQACASVPPGPRRLGRPFAKRTSGKFSLRAPSSNPPDNPTPNRSARASALTLDSPPPAVTPSHPLFAAIPSPPNRWLSALGTIAVIGVIAALGYLYAWPWARTQLREIEADRAVNHDLPPSSPNAEFAQVAAPAPDAAYSAAAAKAIHDAALANQMAQGSQVTLFLVSEPLGARTVCGWTQGRVDGVTPMKCVVPQGARVHLESYAVDYAPGSKDIIANSAQAVSITLLPKPAK